MSKCLLITRPNHDLTTTYLYHWSRLILNQATKSKIKVIDLKAGRASKKEVTGIINKVQPSCIIFNGHGNETEITGMDNKTIIKAGKNEKLLVGTIVYAISCRSAKLLGPQCIKSGTKTYLGYIDDFIFITDEDKTTQPLKDKSAALFLEPAYQIAVALIKGNSATFSFKKSQQLFKKNIYKLMTSATSPEEKDLLPYLFWDLQNQVCLGDKNAAI